MLKMILSCLDWSNQVQSMMKTRQDNDMTDHIGLLHSKIETELLGPIWSGIVCDENQIGQRLDNSYKYGLHWKQN